MVLTGAGYVPLGQEAEPIGKRARRFAKDNPYHDERGRFTTAAGAGGAAASPTKGAIRVAQEGEGDEEDNRGRLEESGDPLAELKQQEWGNAIQTLRALDPSNPKLSYIAP
jgi:hypothetical protein